MATDFLHAAESAPRKNSPRSQADTTGDLIDKKCTKSVQDNAEDEFPVEHGVMMALVMENGKTGKPG